MCDPISILSAVAGPLLSSVLGGGSGDTPAAPPEPKKPPQRAKEADSRARGAFSREKATTPTKRGTVKTGPRGLEDTALQLGHTLLGE